MPTKSQTQWKLKSGASVTQKQMADYLHVSARHLRRLVAVMPDHCKKNLPDAIDWYVNRGVKTENIDEDTKDGEGTFVSKDDLLMEKLVNEVKKLRHDANRSLISEDKERHDFDVQKGIYVERQVVEHRIADISKGFSDKLFAIPNRVSSLMMQAKSEAEVKRLLNAELRKITADIDEMEIFD